MSTRNPDPAYLTILMTTRSSMTSPLGGIGRAAGLTSSGHAKTICGQPGMTSNPAIDRRRCSLLLVTTQYSADQRTGRDETRQLAMSTPIMTGRSSWKNHVSIMTIGLQLATP